MDQGNDTHAQDQPAPDRRPEAPGGGTNRLPPAEWEGYAVDVVDGLLDG
jgi:hypothetical protein